MLRMVSYPHRPPSGHITCYLNRTYHVLPTLIRTPFDKLTVERWPSPEYETSSSDRGRNPVRSCCSRRGLSRVYDSVQGRARCGIEKQQRGDLPDGRRISKESGVCSWGCRTGLRRSGRWSENLRRRGPHVSDGSSRLPSTSSCGAHRTPSRPWHGAGR